MSQPHIVAIILNWRQPESTVRCVRALQAMTGPDLDYLILDNGSDDGSAFYLRDALPEALVIALPNNVGFASGANHGLRHAIDRGYDLALLVNNDAFADKEMLVSLLAETNDDIALLSPTILYEHDPTLIWHAGARQDPCILEARERGRDRHYGSEWISARDVDYVVGTCLLVNLVAVAEVGLLDEDYFLYYEDLDWSIRLRQAGFRLRVVGRSKIYHRVSLSSGGDNSPTQVYHLGRSSIRFFSRHMHGGRPLAIGLYRLGSAIKRLARLSLAGNWSSVQAYLQGLRAGLSERRHRP